MCATLRSSIILADSLLTNSFPLSVCICAGIPNLQNCSSKMVSATVSAFLFWIDVTTAYLVNASVMHSTNFLLLSAVNIGPNRSACQLGHSGIGSGARGVGFIGDHFRC